MCFFAIIGVVPRERVIGRETRFCPLCGRETLHKTVEVKHWFTFFFLPLFPVSGKRTYTRCQCGLARVSC
jgi:hypothetical protein